MMAGFGDEGAYTHMAADLHHRLEIGEVGVQLGIVRMHQVGVDADAVDRQTGIAISGGDRLAVRGREAGEVGTAVVFPVGTVSLREKKLDGAEAGGRQLGRESGVGVAAKPKRRDADGQAVWGGLRGGPGRLRQSSAEGGERGRLGHGREHVTA